MLLDTFYGVALLFVSLLCFIVATETRYRWLTVASVLVAFVCALVGMRFIVLPG